jgi:hypothetical protein
MGLVTVTYWYDVERSSNNHRHEFFGELRFCLAVEVFRVFHRLLLFGSAVMFAFAFGMGVVFSRF